MIALAPVRRLFFSVTHITRSPLANISLSHTIMDITLANLALTRHSTTPLRFISSSVDSRAGVAHAHAWLSML